MPITLDQFNRWARRLRAARVAAGADPATLPTKPEEKAVIDAIVDLHSASAYKTQVSAAIDVARPGIPNGQKRIYLRVAMALMAAEGLD
jgi:hypothetical protein